MCEVAGDDLSGSPVGVLYSAANRFLGVAVGNLDILKEAELNALHCLLNPDEISTTILSYYFTNLVLQFFLFCVNRWALLIL
jgi:hypothetical protein